MTDSPEPGAMPPAARHGFAFWLGVIVAAAFVFRVAYVIWYDNTHLSPGGDSFYYHWQARALARGHWFLEPYQWKCRHTEVPSAAHPPLYSLFLSLPALLGGTTTLVQRLWTVLPGVATVLLVGLVGRELRDERTGLVAAGIAAAYPGLWINDALLMSETMFASTVALLVWLAYRYRRRPTPRAAVILGLALGLTTLARAEAIFFAAALVLPLLLLTGGDPPAARLRRLAVAAVATSMLLAPWVVFNLVRFDRPVTLSTGLGSVLSVANCDETYDGRLLGLWSVNCAIRMDNVAVGRPADAKPVLIAKKVGAQLCVGFDDGLDRRLGDESEQERLRRRASIEYVGDNLDRLSVVIPARLGRTFELYKPGQGIVYSDFVENRGKWASRLGQWTFYLLAVLALAGMVGARRRRVVLLPIAAAWLLVVVTTVFTYGNVRFRIPIDVTLPALAAYWLVGFFDRRRPGGAT